MTTLNRRAQERASTATCPVCGSRDKPLAQGRFTRHIDSVTGECPAAGHTPAEARSLRKEGGDDPDVSKVRSIPRTGGGLQHGTSVACGGPAEPGAAERAGDYGAAPATPTAPTQRTRKPRSDRALYIVLAEATAPVLFHTQDEAGTEATHCAQDDAASGAYIVYQVRPLRRFQLQHGVQEKPLGRVRKRKAEE